MTYRKLTGVSAAALAAGLLAACGGAETNTETAYEEETAAETRTADADTDAATEMSDGSTSPDYTAERDIADADFEETDSAQGGPVSSIAMIASGEENLSTLVAAVEAANLVETLNGPGPYTVFAPTNAAFDKLPEGKLEELQKAENSKELTGLLTYHVLEGEVMAADLIEGIESNGGEYRITTMSDAELVATLDGDTVTLTDAKGNTARVETVDIDASNGVVHVIDTVVLPG